MIDLTYYQWLAQFRKADNAIGDLARDVTADRHHNACYNAIITFEDSWKRYELEVLESN